MLADSASLHYNQASYVINIYTVIYLMDELRHFVISFGDVLVLHLADG